MKETGQGNVCSIGWGCLCEWSNRVNCKNLKHPEYGLFNGLNSVPEKFMSTQELQNMTLLGNRIFAYVIS